jgi:glycosyltransferase involved in cell wall biosynthesis
LTSLDFGGVERHMELLASEAVGAQLNHNFWAIGGGGAAADALRAMGAEVQCRVLPVAIPSPPALWALYRGFRRTRPTVVHTHGAEANFHGQIAAKLAGVPVRIAEEIGIPCHGYRAKIAFRQVYRAAHRVVGISQAVTEWLIRSGEVPPHKALSIYNPVRLPPAHEPQTVLDVFRIGFVGRLEPVKNPLALLDAARQLLNWGLPVELWIVGDGTQRTDIEDRIEANKLAGKVRLFGYCRDPTAVVRSCQVYLQPSISEGFGIALVEAMGCGVPVIATAVGGAPEIIEHGVTGWLLDEPSPDKIAAALRRAWRLGPQRLGEMGRRARQSVEGRFEPALHLQRIEALYAEVAAESGIAELGAPAHTALS